MSIPADQIVYAVEKDCSLGLFESERPVTAAAFRQSKFAIGRAKPQVRRSEETPAAVAELDVEPVTFNGSACDRASVLENETARVK
jgi:hypothetical protein